MTATTSRPIMVTPNEINGSQMSMSVVSIVVSLLAVDRTTVSNRRRFGNHQKRMSVAERLKYGFSGQFVFLGSDAHPQMSASSASRKRCFIAFLHLSFT